MAGSLVRRLPVRLRMHWRLLALALALVLVLVLVLGALRVRPLVLSDSNDKGDNKSTVDIAGTVDLFDPRVPHSLTLTFSAKKYDEMVKEFLSDDEKDYVEADLVVDGTSLPSVGIRLKGNSTLMALRRAGRGPATNLSTEEPEDLPWLINVDHYVDGRRYQGHEEIAVRPAGRTGSTLNEALALDLVGQAGEPTQRYAYSTFTVNGRPSATRLLVEVPDHRYADDLGRGVLYKALASSDFRYQGEDPTAYADDFDQINRKGSRDVQPIIDLIRWVEQADDAQFAAGLGERLDVDSFARYAVLQNLLLNFDDMAGPGRNYYLYYDLDEHRFQVINWDLNLALTGSPTQGPFEAGRFGPPGGVVVGGPGAPVAGPGAGPGAAGPGLGGGGFRAGNRLKERFLATPAFRERYVAAYQQLYRRLLAGGAALRTLDTITAFARVAGSADAATAPTLRALLEARTQSLAATEVGR